MAAPIRINVKEMAEMESLHRKLSGEAAGQSAAPSTAAKQVAQTAATKVSVPDPSAWASAFAQAHTQAQARTGQMAMLGLSAVHAGLGAGQGIGAGGIASQLAGWTQFAGLLGKVNPVLFGVTAGLGALAAATVGAAQRLTEFGLGQMQTGGTAGQTQMGRTLAGALGLDPNAFAGLAGGLRQRVATDPMAMAAAGRLGLRSLPKGFGDVNEAKLLLDVIKGIRAAPSDAAARQLAQRTGTEELLGARFFSPEMMAKLEAFAGATSKAFTPEAISRGQEFNNLLSQVKEGFGALVVTVGTPFLGAINAAIKALQTHGAGKPQTIAEQQLEQQKRTVEELKLVRQGLYGGGARAAGAIPPGLRG